MRNLYISDTHFSHKNIIKFDNRPFASVTEMDEYLIEQWNKKVNKDDTVNILGDFCWGKANRWLEILEQLKGNKVLIKGNHDLKNIPSSVKNHFQDIKERKCIQDEGRKVIMNHYPEPFYWHDYDERVCMLYGHVHNTTEAQAVEAIRRIVLPAVPNHKAHLYNCWCGFFGWAPATLDEIIEFYKELDKNEICSSNGGYFA